MLMRSTFIQNVIREKILLIEPEISAQMAALEEPVAQFRQYVVQSIGEVAECTFSSSLFRSGENGSIPVDVSLVPGVQQATFMKALSLAFQADFFCPKQANVPAAIKSESSPALAGGESLHTAGRSSAVV